MPQSFCVIFSYGITLRIVCMWPLCHMICGPYATWFTTAATKDRGGSCCYRLPDVATCVAGTWLQDWHLLRHQGWTYRAPVRWDRNLECLSLCWHAPLRRDHPSYCTEEVRNPGGTYELPCIRLLYYKILYMFFFNCNIPFWISAWGTWQCISWVQHCILHAWSIQSWYSVLFPGKLSHRRQRPDLEWHRSYLEIYSTCCHNCCWWMILFK